MNKESQKKYEVGGNLVEKDGKILMVQEKGLRLSHLLGKWNFPMGKREEGEDIKSCAKREGREETGHELNPLDLIGKYPLDLILGVAVVCFIFRSEIVGGKITIPKDIMDVRWLSYEEIEKLAGQNKLATSCVMEAIRDYRAGKKIPFDVVQ